MRFVVLNLEINNIKSICGALKLIGDVLSIKKFTKKFKVNDSDVIVIPGNGSFDHGIEMVRKKNFDILLKEHFGKNKIIGICLGMQIMCTSSEEGKEKGLGLINLHVKKISEKKIKLPLLGWYDVKFKDNYFKTKSFYFNNNYCYETKASITLGFLEKIPSMIKFKNFYGFQFHPEKSGANGINLLKTVSDEK